VGAHAEVLDCFPRGPPSSEKDGVTSSGSPQSQSVQGNRFTTSGKDPLFSTAGESEGSDGHLGNGSKANIIRDGADLDDDFALEFWVRRGFLCDAGEGEGRAVGPAHAQSLQDDAVEVGGGSASQKSVQPDQKQKIRIRQLEAHKPRKD